MNLKNKYMKNIHLLPTDKDKLDFPFIAKNCFNNNYTIVDSTFKDNCELAGMNIYITSDEEIKEGDYFIALNGSNDIYKANKVWLDIIKENPNPSQKIILTTNQYLIKYGVQAIDDEFLEWFVKNPNCEYVEIEEKLRRNNYQKIFEIIIPEEESKQQTLKEVAENGWLNDNSMSSNDKKAFENGFMEGAKWQAERMYSEEEVKELLSKFHIATDGTKKFEDEWFEQFKKK